MPAHSTPTDPAVEELRVAMTRRRMKQEALAAGLGVSRMTVGRRLSGEVDMTIPEFRAAADVLGYDVTVELTERPSTSSPARTGEVDVVEGPPALDGSSGEATPQASPLTPSRGSGA